MQVALSSMECQALKSKQGGVSTVSLVELPSASPMRDVQAAEDLQQLLKERDGLRELVSEQLAAATAHTARIHALEEDLQNMQNATKLAAQVMLLPPTPGHQAEPCPWCIQRRP